MGEVGGAERAWGWEGGWTQEPRVPSSSAVRAPPTPASGTTRTGVSPESEDACLCRSRGSRRRPRGGVSPAPHPTTEAVGPRGWEGARRGREGREQAVWGRSLAFFGGARVPSGSFSNFPEVSRDGAGGGDTIYRAGDRWSIGEWSLSVRPPAAPVPELCPRASPAGPGEGRELPGLGGGGGGLLQGVRGAVGSREGLEASPEPANRSPCTGGQLEGSD